MAHCRSPGAHPQPPELGFFFGGGLAPPEPLASAGFVEVWVDVVAGFFGRQLLRVATGAFFSSGAPASSSAAPVAGG